MTIGIIEDDTLLHQALKTVLQNAGYQTVSAYTKQEALTTITGSESLLLIDAPCDFLFIFRVIGGNQ